MDILYDIVCQKFIKVIVNLYYRYPFYNIKSVSSAVTTVGNGQVSMEKCSQRSRLCIGEHL